MVKEIDKETLRKRIVEARQQRGISQAKLAEEAGVTPAAISQIEKGHRIPTIPVLRRIASVLWVSLDYLIGKTKGVELEDLLQHEEVKEFFRGFQSLDPQDQETIMKNIEFLKSRSKRGKK